MLSEADLAAFEPKWEAPLHTTYRGYDVYSNGHTSRGGFEVRQVSRRVNDARNQGADLVAPLGSPGPGA